MKKVHISLTSISSRVDDLHLVVDSLLQQSYPNFQIHLFVSKESYLLDEGVQQIPQELKKLEDVNSNFNIRYTKNTGSYRKLLPLLESELWSIDDLIATADDDTIYPTRWLEKLVEAYQSHRCIIAYRGHYMANKDGLFLPYRQWMTHGISQTPSILNLPTGKDGVLYPPELISGAISNIQRAMEIAPTTDDLWFKWHTAAMGAKVFCINTDYGSDTFDENSKEIGSSLYDNFNRSGGNDLSIARLIKYGEEELGIRLLADKPNNHNTGKIAANASFKRHPIVVLSYEELMSIMKHFSYPHRLFCVLFKFGDTYKLWKNTLTILLSGKFEIEFYKSQSGVTGSQIIHFLSSGNLINIKPSKIFSPIDYLSVNPDVADANINPFLHYIEHGQFEERKLG